MKGKKLRERKGGAKSCWAPLLPTWHLLVKLLSVLFSQLNMESNSKLTLLHISYWLGYILMVNWLGSLLQASNHCYFGNAVVFAPSIERTAAIYLIYHMLCSWANYLDWKSIKSANPNWSKLICLVRGF